MSSPVRAFKAVGGTPRFIRRGRGAVIEDEDGNRYIDFVMSWGPLIHGHAPQAVIRAITKAAKHGTSFGAPTQLEVKLAERIRTFMPSLERMRFVNSGTEATMSAVRVARASTGRSLIVKFQGCYHGHGDSFLVQAGSGALTLGVPTSPGVTPGTAADTLTARYNDLASCGELFAAHPSRIAAIIVEPVAGNMGVVLPTKGFLEGLRQLCDREGAVLIFDEVISGFRCGPGGAQAHFGVTPDLTCLGKIIGGGLPVGAYGGRDTLMDLVAPAGPVYQAGTLSGNPLAMAAGLAALHMLSPKLYARVERLTHQLGTGLIESARAAGVPLQINGFGSLLTPFFTSVAVNDLATALTADTTAYAKFFQGMLRRGVFIPPSQFEAWFISGAHTDRQIRQTIAAALAALRETASPGG